MPGENSNVIWNGCGAVTESAVCELEEVVVVVLAAFTGWVTLPNRMTKNAVRPKCTMRIVNLSSEIAPSFCQSGYSN